MQNIWLMLSSITYAIKAQQLLERNGIPSSFSKTPIQQSGRGCGYSLKIRKRDLQRVRALLDEAGIKVLGEVTQGAARR